MEYYLAIKKNKIMPFAAIWIELETLILSEVRKRQIPYDITYIWNLTYSINKPFHRKKLIDLEKRLVVAKGEGEGEGVGWTGSLGLVDVNYCIWSG